jgi:hypothetical protein
MSRSRLKNVVSGRQPGEAGAQGEAEQDGHSVNGRPAERDCHGRHSPEFQAKRERGAQKPELTRQSTRASAKQAKHRFARAQRPSPTGDGPDRRRRTSTARPRITHAQQFLR